MRTYTAIALIALLAVSHAQTVSVTPYDTVTCNVPSADATKNLLQTLPSAGVTTDTCTVIATGGTTFFKITGTATSVTAFKTYATTADCTNNATPKDVADVTATSWAYGTCYEQKLNADNAHATASGVTTKPAFKLSWDSAASKIKVAAYDSKADCEGTASAGATKNLLFNVKTTALPTGTTHCTQIGTTGKYLQIVAPDANTVTSFKSYDNSACSTGAADVAATGQTLAYGTCIAQKTDNAAVTVTGNTPAFKLAYTAATPGASKTSAMNLSVGIFALLALLVAALF